MDRKWIALIAWLVVFQLIGSLMGYLTETNIATWYQELNKSTLTPPGYVFGIVWTALYALLAVIGWHLFANRHLPFYKRAFNIFAIQMLMNWAWTPLFFQFHWIGFSVIWLATMTVVTAALIFYCRQQARYTALLLLPYLLWLTFATYLNGMIWLLN